MLVPWRVIQKNPDGGSDPLELYQPWFLMDQLQQSLMTIHEARWHGLGRKHGKTRERSEKKRVKNDSARFGICTLLTLKATKKNTHFTSTQLYIYIYYIYIYE